MSQPAMTPGAAKAGWRSALDVVATVLMIVAAGFVIWKNVDRRSVEPRSVPLPSNPVAISGAPVLGRPGAAVMVMVFSDFECPYCGTFARDVFPQLKSKYVETGEVSFTFRHLPLRIHKQAQTAAQAATCFAGGDQFWAMHDAIFADQKRLDPTSLIDHAQVLGFSGDRLRACMEPASPAKAVVEADVALASALGITSTPAFLVGAINQTNQSLNVKTTILGAQSLAQFVRAIDGVLSKKD